MTSLAPELARRQTNTDKVLALFRAKPMEWIDAHDIALVGGFMAWRTRVADARAIAENSGWTIEWNKQRYSMYRYRPIPQGPSAETPRERRLF